MAAKKCDFCSAEAVYDGKTQMGPWAFMCNFHFLLYGVPTTGMYSLLQKATSKECRLCRKVKPLTDFYTYTDSNGIVRQRTECKQCNLEQKKRASFGKR